MSMTIVLGLKRPSSLRAQIECLYEQGDPEQKYGATNWQNPFYHAKRSQKPGPDCFYFVEVFKVTATGRN